MTTAQRLEGLKRFCEETICAEPMKRAGKDALDVCYVNPDVYIGFYPDTTEIDSLDVRTAPAVLVVPQLMQSNATNEQRFDRYNNIVRTDELEHLLTVQFVFVMYDPGERTETAVASGDYTMIDTGTHAGLLRLTDWMDSLSAALLGAKHIPHTDLAPKRDSIAYSPMMEMGRIVDKRPLYFGLLQAQFWGHVEETPNPEYSKLLE